MQFLSLRCYFVYLNIIWTVSALKVSRSLYCFTASISHSVENCFPRLWGTGISDTIFCSLEHDDVIDTVTTLCGGRQAIQARPDYPNRVVSPSGGLPNNMQPVAPASNRPICHEVHHQVASVLCHLYRIHMPSHQ